MVTRKLKPAYKSSIPPAQSRPLPLLRAKQDDRQYKQLLRNDAHVAVLVLNASHGFAAHERLVAIRMELENLRTGTVELKRIEREIFKEMRPQGADGPGRAGTQQHIELAAQYKSVFENLNTLHIALNDRLARYAFRPCVSYTINSDDWRFGLVPDSNRRFFQTKVGQFTVTESDAVMSLVRLDASGELNKVKLCRQCKMVWRVSLREIDRFCGDVCREAFYANSPNYHERKAANQRKYREGLKQLQARGLA
jgi:hypothetical protein